MGRGLDWTGTRDGDCGRRRCEGRVGEEKGRGGKKVWVCLHVIYIADVQSPAHLLSLP
jgi:hypothetical protein